MQINNQRDLQKHFLIFYFQNGEKEKKTSKYKLVLVANSPASTLSRFCSSSSPTLIDDGHKRTSTFILLVFISSRLNIHNLFSRKSLPVSLMLYSYYVLLVCSYFVNWNKQLKIILASYSNSIQLPSDISFQVHPKAVEIMQCPGIWSVGVERLKIL
jgi:hypothetical protein